MANLMNRAIAGTMESSDVFVEVEPSPEGNIIEIESVVEEQFGAQIMAAVQAVLAETGTTNARVSLKDRGALDCVIRARVETALLRGEAES